MCSSGYFIYFSKWGHAEDTTGAANGSDDGKSAKGDQNLHPSKENKKEEKNRIVEKNGDLNMET